MPSNTICKTVHQYSREPVPDGDMKKLQEIANDYCKVKNYVYIRFGGIGSLSKLYPGYTIQNEMTASGFRDSLGLPSVYFYLAVFEAIGDIKSQWTRTKAKVLDSVNQNEGFTDEERHYLRFVLKVSNLFTAVLEQEPLGTIRLPDEIQRQRETLAGQVDAERLNRYLCRQVRRRHVRLNAKQAVGFSVSERAYRYGDGGIYLSTKENRKRIFVPLTDRNQYKKQLYVRLFPAEGRIEIRAAVDVAVCRHPDYAHPVGIALGMFTMLVTHEGHRYGERLGEYHLELTGWIRDQNIKYNMNRDANPGRKKYHAKKHRLDERLHSYINKELNRFLQTEKPDTVYLAKLPPSKPGGAVKRINFSVTMWQRGYIKSRLLQKCQEHSVKLVEVFGKDISNECSSCGAIGAKKEGMFTCPACGILVEDKTNSARNAKKRGEKGHKNH